MTTPTADRTDDDRLIDLAHVIDDVETQRTALLRQTNAAVLLLADALHAIRNGRIDVADEFVDRSLGHLRAGLAAQR